jgi:hypothetical protein
MSPEILPGEKAALIAFPTITVHRLHTVAFEIGFSPKHFYDFILTPHFSYPFARYDAAN